MTALSASREAGAVDEANCAVALPIIHLTARKSSGEPLTWPADLSMTRSMKYSTSSSQRESSKPPFEVRVSSLRRTVSAAAYFRMMSSDRLRTLLCQDVDTVAAFACDRFAYSLARSLSRCRPVVRTGSILPGWARSRRENLYAIGLCDRPVTVSQGLRSLACIVKWRSRNSASSIQFGCRRHGSICSSSFLFGIGGRCSIYCPHCCRGDDNDNEGNPKPSARGAAGWRAGIE
jgi:hypothetical protein